MKRISGIACSYRVSSQNHQIENLGWSPIQCRHLRLSQREYSNVLDVLFSSLSYQALSLRMQKVVRFFNGKRRSTI